MSPRQLPGQTMTLFTTPLLSPVLRLLSRGIMRLVGWRFIRPVPEDLHKCVLIAAPHTSYWDFALFLVALLTTRMRLTVLIKHTLFIGPIGWFLRYCGAIPIDRQRAAARVTQMVRAFETLDHLNLLITPEGTRSARTHWKTGFYHIAMAAKVPIAIGVVDAARKTITVAEIMTPSGNIDADMAKIYAIYDKAQGLRPENYASPNKPAPDPTSDKD